MTWNSPTTHLFIQLLLQTINNALHCWPFVGIIHRWTVDFLKKDELYGKHFHAMTSSSIACYPWCISISMMMITWHRIGSEALIRPTIFRFSDILESLVHGYFACIGLSVFIYINTLRPRQNGRHFPDHIFKCIFFNEKFWISLKISLKFVPKVRINNIRALVQIMAWRRPGDKPLSEPMMI